MRIVRAQRRDNNLVRKVVDLLLHPAGGPMSIRARKPSRSLEMGGMPRARTSNQPTGPPKAHKPFPSTYGSRNVNLLEGYRGGVKESIVGSKMTPAE